MTTQCGWGGRIRTSEYGFQRPAPYRLATPHRRSAATLTRRAQRRGRPAKVSPPNSREAQPQGAARKGCPQEVKCSRFQRFLATGRPRRSYWAREMVLVSNA